MTYHFGLEAYLGLALYCTGIVASLLSLFWRPSLGLYFLIPLIPLQTTRYRMMAFPLGGSLVNIILLAVALGLLRGRKWIIPRTPWTVFIGLYAFYTFGSIFLNSDNLILRLTEWWNYMLMPLLFFLVTVTVKDVRQMKFIVLLMCLAVFVMDKSFWDAVKDRDFSTFSRDLQEGGSMGYAGVQGLAAFNAQYAWFMVAVAGAMKKLPMRVACLFLALFAANCVMYSFSRGGYVALLAGWVFVGIVRYRKLLVILMLFGITWASVVPNAVRERVLMTYDPNEGELDNSAALRVELWNDALDLIRANPVLGSGYHTYAYMKRVHNYEDTHNIYLKVLVETGLIGLAFLLWFLAMTFRIGCRLFRYAQEPFFSVLGLGLAAWIVCTAVGNLFGDRWTYFQISGYLWVLAGLVARAIAIESDREAAEPATDSRLAPVSPVVLAAT